MTMLLHYDSAGYAEEGTTRERDTPDIAGSLMPERSDESNRKENAQDIMYENQFLRNNAIL